MSCYYIEFVAFTSPLSATRRERVVAMIKESSVTNLSDAVAVWGVTI